MATLVELVNHWAAVGTGLAWAVAWQSAVLIGLAAAVAVLLRRSSPGLRYWLWQIVVIKVFLMPFWTMALPLPWPSLGEATPQRPTGDKVAAVTLTQGLEGSTELESTGISQPIPTLPLRLSWLSWLLIGWLLVVVGQFAVLMRQRFLLRRLLREAVVAPQPLHALVGELARQLGLRHVPATVLTDVEGSLFVCGLWRSVLVLPKDLLATLDGDRLRQILLHELAHVQRHDLLFGWPVEVARRLFFFHPLIHWLANQVRLERELACDQVAMAASGHSPSDYLETLIHVVTRASQPAALKAAYLAGNN